MNFERISVRALVTLLLPAALTLAAPAPARADLPIKKQSCPLKPSGLSECKQIDPAKAKLISIEVSYSSSSTFELLVVGDKFTTTNYKVVVWQELDTMGGDFGSFYITSTGNVTVAPKDALPTKGQEILLTGSYKKTETDPAKLKRFIGTSVVPITPIVQPSTVAGDHPTVGTGTVKKFERVSSSVSGSLDLNYEPIIKKPVIKLPHQDFPQPFTVPPYPKPK